MAGLSTQQAQNLYNAQQKQTSQTIADIIAQGDALKGEASARLGGGTQGYYSGGTPGYYVDNSGAVNGQYNTIRDDVSNVFAQAVAAIQAQAPFIQSQAAGRGDALMGLAQRQGTDASAASAQQLSDQQLAAQRMGIDAAPQTSRAGNIAAALSQYRNQGAGAQKQYFSAIGQTALGRNDAQAAAFAHTNEEQQKQIEAARQAALAKASYWVPGSRGKFVSTYGSADKKSDKKLISSITKEQKAITKAQQSDAAQRAKDPSIRQSAVQANRRLT